MSKSISGDVRLRTYRVHGRVQGVGLRWWARSVAVRLGLGGHVWNLSNGSVEAHVAGRFEEFETRLAEGPQFARVTLVEYIEPDRTMSRVGFAIVLQQRVGR